VVPTTTVRLGTDMGHPRPDKASAAELFGRGRAISPASRGCAGVRPTRRCPSPRASSSRRAIGCLCET